MSTSETTPGKGNEQTIKPSGISKISALDTTYPSWDVDDIFFGRATTPDVRTFTPNLDTKGNDNQPNGTLNPAS